MANPSLATKIRGEAYQLVIWQLVGVVILALLALLIKGTTSALSVFCGGMAYGLANLFFVWLVFRYAKPSEMVQFVMAFCAGEMFKLIVSAFLFLMIVKYLPVSLLSVLVGFVGAIVMFWVACFWFFSKQSTKQ